MNMDTVITVLIVTFIVQSILSINLAYVLLSLIGIMLFLDKLIVCFN